MQSLINPESVPSDTLVPVQTSFASSCGHILVIALEFSRQWELPPCPVGCTAVPCSLYSCTALYLYGPALFYCMIFNQFPEPERNTLHSHFRLLQPSSFSSSVKFPSFHLINPSQDSVRRKVRKSRRPRPTRRCLKSGSKESAAAWATAKHVSFLPSA